MTDLETQVHAIKARIEDSRAKRAKADHQKEVAEQALERAMTLLHNEFGVESIPAAKKKLQQLEDQLRAECKKVEDLLAAAEDGT